MFTIQHAILFVVLALFSFQTLYALPMDWKGSFGVDSTTLRNYANTHNEQTSSGGDGSQQIPHSTTGGLKDASFQSYLLKLQPSIILNDSATFFGEMTTGYNHGGMMGDGSTQRKESNAAYGDALFLHSTSKGESNLLLSQFYMQLYSDSATFTIGRQSVNWGLGAIFNSGEDVWDRYATIEDGVRAGIKIGNFMLTPYYAKVNSGAVLTKADDVKSYGFTLLYNNLQKDMAFGLLFGKRTSSGNNSFHTGNSGVALGSTRVKILDLFLQKKFGRYELNVEAPIHISGLLGQSFAAGEKADYKAKAVLLESKYTLNDRWKVGVDGGYVSGEDGKSGDYSAMYLNPNYQIAHIMFRYNRYAIADNTQNIFDSSIANTNYIKLHTSYEIDQWLWKWAFIYAQAQEVADGGGAYAFNHAKNKRFVSNYAQNKDLGYEFDFSGDYMWNNSVTLTGKFGYYVVGDYYKYTNTATEIDLSNSYQLSLGVAATF